MKTKHKTYYDGAKIFYGINQDFITLPILNLPSTTIKVRRKMRCDDYMKVFVKTSDGAISGYQIDDMTSEGITIEKYPTLGVNQTTQ